MNAIWRGPRQNTGQRPSAASAEFFLPDPAQTLAEAAVGILCAALLAGAAFPLLSGVWRWERAIRGFGFGESGAARLAREWETVAGGVRIPPCAEGDSLVERVGARGLRIDGTCFAPNAECVISVSGGRLAISKGGTLVFRSEIPVCGVDVWRTAEGRPIGLALTFESSAEGSGKEIRALFGSAGLPGGRE